MGFGKYRSSKCDVSFSTHSRKPGIFQSPGHAVMLGPRDLMAQSEEGDALCRLLAALELGCNVLPCASVDPASGLRIVGVQRRNL